MDNPTQCLSITPEYHARAKKRMERIDALPKDIRELIHEFGYTVVNACLEVGVTKARRIHHLILQLSAGSCSDGGDGLVRNRCYELGRKVGGNPSEEMRAECASAFLRGLRGHH